MDNIKNLIESSRVPIVFNDMLDDWELFKWNLDKWNSIFEHQSLNCRKGRITCTKEPLWESKCLYESHSFSEVINMSKDIENSGNWLYFDYKHIGKTVNENIFKSISWKKFGYENLGPKDSTLWIGSIGAHTPCHQDLYGINLVAQVHGKKRWILMPPEMGKYLKPSRVPYEESSCYSKINFSCPDNIKDIDDACRCVTVVLSPGDVLIVPHKWWHYVENLTTAVSINTWIQTPKYDNMARLKESVVRFMASSLCSGVSKNIQSRLLNPNEIFSPSMIAESINFIDQSIKMIKNEENITDSKEPDSTTLIKYQYKVYEPDQCLSKVELDTTYHRHNHTSSSLKSDLNTDITHRLLDSLCDENVINQIVSNLIEID
ncbi:HSPB1-associated protein 1 isoform X1 [Myzus persicae]|uniref:HSPB1-associated protein 1 isoform X1 n=1 Tax=Myzus persicae TaxID=13164 RepID=UPI000B9347AD|nr:HSPB1-associated protein 1 isoform X1 [Myzus persicae]XP_022174309.1 HSPB1-associated protein 1 isoform X1 [Myzus persicae]XP_022174310.1 HSPB1-associated protein 1 isoform X1 [Myzus persicae]